MYLLYINDDNVKLYVQQMIDSPIYFGLCSTKAQAKVFDFKYQAKAAAMQLELLSESEVEIEKLA